MSFKNRPIPQAIGELIRLSTGLGLAFASHAASAQSAPANTQVSVANTDAAAASGEVQQVVTTGTRGSTRTEEESLAPIDVIGAEDLAHTGKQNLREALSSLAPSYTNSSGFKGQIGLAVTAAVLRGLGSTNVLVLVNGKRRHISSLLIAGSGPVGADLDLIPTAAVARIEVLRDGAAAQYGSDAIAGVINIILKSNDSGGSASLTAGRYMKTVGPQGLHGTTYSASVDQGFTLNKDGFLNIAGSVIKQQATNVAGPVPYGTDIAARNIYFPINGQPDPRETSESRYRQILGRPNSLTKTISYNAEVPINDQFQVYSFGTLSQRHSQGFGTYRTANSPQNILSVYPDGFLPHFVVVEQDYQANIGVKGQNLLGWDWDITSSRGNDDGNSRNENTINPTLGPSSPTSFDNGHLINTEWTSNVDASRKVATGVFAKPLAVAFGAEFRRTVFQQTPGQYESYADGSYVYPAGSPLAGTKPNPGAAGFAGYSPAVSGEYVRKDGAAYLDLEQEIAKTFTIGATGRLERLSGERVVRVGKLSGRWDFLPGYAVRATINNGFSAPALVQKYFTNVLGAYSTNPVTGVLSQSYSRQVPAYDPAAIALGAKDLKPESSHNVSFGFVLKPAPDYNLTIDAYQIDINGRIALSSTLQSVQVAPVLAAAGLSTNQNVSFWLNAGDTRTRGIDLVADHTQQLQNWGAIKWTLLGSYNRTTLRRIEPASAAVAGTGAVLIGKDTISNLTSNYPKTTFSLNGDWSLNGWDTILKVTRYGQVTAINSTLQQEHVNAAFILDGSLGYQVTPKVKVSVGANNLLNRRPEQLSAAARKVYGFPVSTPNYSWYSPYGVDGGYYYGRVEVSW